MKKYIIITALLILILTACNRNPQPEAYVTNLEGEVLHIPVLAGGIIKGLFVKQGDWVEAGDTLALIDTREISYQVEQLEAQMGELDVQIRIASTATEQARKDYQHVLDKTRRVISLYEQNVISRQEYEDATNLQQKSQSMLTNSENQLILAQASKQKMLAQMKLLRKKTSDAEIISPASGMVSSLYFQKGEAVMPYANLLQLIDTRYLECKIYLGEEKLAGVHIGDKVQLKSAGTSNFTGEVVAIANHAEFTPKQTLTPDTRASMVYAVKIKVANPQGVLKDGMPVEVFFK